MLDCVPNEKVSVRTQVDSLEKRNYSEKKISVHKKSLVRSIYTGNQKGVRFVIMKVAYERVLEEGN